MADTNETPEVNDEVLVPDPSHDTSIEEVSQAIAAIAVSSSDDFFMEAPWLVKRS